MADFDSSIKVMFGGDTTGLKHSIGEANESVHGFEKGLGGIGREFSHLQEYGGAFLAGLGMKELGKAIFDVIDDAQKLRDELERIGEPIDDATRNIASVGDAFDQAKVKAEHFGFVVLNAFKEIEDAQRLAVTVALGGSIKEAVEAEASAEKQVEVARKLAETKKRLAEENSPEKIAALTDELAKTQQKNLEDQLSGTSKINALLADQLDLQAKLGTLKAGTAAYLKTEIELSNKAKEVATESAKADEALAQSRIASIKQEASLDESSNGKVVALLKERSILIAEQLKLNKDSAEYQKLTTSLGQNQVDIAKVYAGQVKATELDKEDQYKYELLMLKNGDAFTVADKAQLDVYEAQTAEKRIQAQLQDLLANGTKNLSDTDKKRISALETQDERAQAILQIAMAQLDAEKQQAETISKQNDELAKQASITDQIAEGQNKITSEFDSQLLLSSRSDQEVQSASNEALKQAISNDQKKLTDAKSKDTSGPFSFGTSLTQIQLENDIAKLKAELDFRDKFNLSLQTGGVAGARRDFQGDPLKFDAVLSQIQNGNTEQTKQTALLTKISNGIATLTDQGNYG